MLNNHQPDVTCLDLVEKYFEKKICKDVEDVISPSVGRPSWYL